jgi:signal transduction histidine kinase
MAENETREEPQRGQMEHEFHGRSALLEAINRVFREELTCESEADVARVCLAVAEELTGSRFGFLGELNEQGRFDTIALSDPGFEACRVPETEAVILIRDMAIRGIWSKPISREASVIVNDPDRDPDRVGVPDGHPPITSFLGVPLKQAERTVGLIALANREGGYDERHQADIEALAAVFAEALYRKRAERRLAEHHERLQAEVEEQTVQLRELVAGLEREIAERKRAEARLAAEQRLLRKLLALEEQERKLVSYEIHDGFVQDVVGAQMLLEAGCQRLKSRDDAVPKELEEVGRLLGRGIAEARRMISERRPMVIDEEGIVEAINYLVAKEEGETGMRLHFEHDVQFKRLDPLLEGTVFRIVQEAVANAKRHSQSERVEIRLSQEGDRFLLEIQDQGVGFDPDRVSEEHFGIRGIYERARLFGGQAEVDSAPGKGTRIRVQLPCKERVVNS